MVAGGHLTDPPTEDAYSGVVSLKSVRLAMFITMHNGLQTAACDIGNAYLEAMTRKKLYANARKEFELLAGKILVIRKALYELKTSGALFHELLSETLKALGYRPSKAEPDLWIKDMGTYYSYIAAYCDNLLICNKSPQPMLEDYCKSTSSRGSAYQSSTLAVICNKSSQQNQM